jgi:hypothetical protein
MADTAFTTDFMGVSTRVDAFERLAVRRLSMVDRNAVTWMSSKPPSAAIVSWSSIFGVCKNNWDVAESGKYLVKSGKEWGLMKTEANF